jgi:hypothetical protein
LNFYESKPDARLREKLEEGLGVVLQKFWGISVIRTPRIARAVALALLVAIASGCAERKPSPEKLFELRAKCDKMVREKFVLMEPRFFNNPLVHNFVSSNLRSYSDCYGSLERVGKLGTSRVVIDGISGKELVSIFSTDSFVAAGMVDEKGKWSVVEEMSASKAIEGYMASADHSTN